MHLYLITRIGKSAHYDEFEEAVVAARSPKDARSIHPDRDWVGANDLGGATWVPPEKVRATRVGTASRRTKRGVVVASFRAG
jgi:hypothetical protein